MIGNDSWICCGSQQKLQLSTFPGWSHWTPRLKLCCGCTLTRTNSISDWCSCTSDASACVFVMVPSTLSGKLPVCVWVREKKRGHCLVTVCINPHMLYICTPYNIHHSSLPVCKPNLSLLVMRADPWMLYDVSFFLSSPCSVPPPALPHFYYSPQLIFWLLPASLAPQCALQTIKC